MKKKNDSLPKNPVGRPPKYTPEFIEELANKLIEWIKNDKNYWLGSFAEQNGLWKAQLNDFAKTNEYFSYALKRAKEAQENKLVLQAMRNEINTTMAIFALKNVAGWRDVQPVEIDMTLSVEQLDFVNMPKEQEKNRFERFYN